MREFLCFITVLVGTILVIACLAVGMGFAIATWDCTQWHQKTGQTTQVIAASCYVRNGDRWELFDTYVKNHHVDLEQGEGE